VRCQCDHDVHPAPDEYSGPMHGEDVPEEYMIHIFFEEPTRLVNGRNEHMKKVCKQCAVNCYGIVLEGRDK